jgi:Methylase involved in ubiquinone/menaquinone biosynthesis
MTATSRTQTVYGESYGGTAPENYERYFVPAIGGPFAADLVAEAALRPGERALDVACGTGIVARLAAERVGTSGTVAGLDVNPGMLAVARSKAAEAGAAIRWYETTAESIPLPADAFDVLFCQLGLQFVADKPAALREMRRVLVPDGRVLVSTPPPNPFFDVLVRALARHVGDEAAAFLRMVFSFHDPAKVEQLFRDAGFRDVAVRTERKPLRLPPARDFLWQYVHCTPLTGLISEMDSNQTSALESDVVRGWQPWSHDGGMTYEQGMIVATARK